jgi:signal transduction histidine kinase
VRKDSSEHARLVVQQATASALAEATTLAEAMPRILRSICECFGWVWAVSWRVDETAAVMRFSSSWHAPTMPLPELERLCRATACPCGEVGLLGRVWASGQPAWIPDLAADDDRALAAVARAEGLHTAFGFPVRAGDHVLGVLEFFSKEVRLLDENLIVMMASVGAQIGHFIRRTEGVVDQARLYEVEQHARTQAEAESKRLAFLANASALLTSALDYDSTLALLPRLAASTLADWCLLDLDDRHGERVRLAVARHELSAKERELSPASLPSTTAALLPPAGEPREVPLLLQDADAAALSAAITDEDHAALACRVGARSLMRIPLRTRGRAFGTMTLLRTETAPRFEAADLTLAKELAWTASIAIEKARVQRESDEALRVRNKFLSIVSHDLKNPLQVIDLNTELLAELLPGAGASPAMAELSRGLARIRRASVRMNAMIRELIDVAHLQAGQPLELERRPTDLVPLVRQLVDEFQQDWTDRTIELETTVAELVGAFDAHRIERVIANLLSNAVKFSRRGGVVHVHLTQDMQEGEPSAVIQVADSGIGVPLPFLPDLFNIFRRATNVEPHLAGAGIGLASAHQVVVSHGGTITVGSVEGEGSTFTVRLPLVPPSP